MPADIKRPQISEFDRWVVANNPAPDLEYSKGFWDYIELIRELVFKFNGRGEHAIGTYWVRTPPPEEEVLMPAVAFEVGTVSFALKYDFGADAAWPFEWTVSVKRRVPYRGRSLGCSVVIQTWRRVRSLVSVRNGHCPSTEMISHRLPVSCKMIGTSLR